MSPSAPAAEPAGDLFRRENLVAWCIVPFDSQKRGPEARAAMLAKLGITQLAYDYRAEHIPTFDAELDALKRHNIKLTAWWFPGALNDEARLILDVLKRHNVQTQLWVMGVGTPTKSAEEQAAQVQAEAARIRPIAVAAAEIGCQVALYNHGGWFGDPVNQLAIIEELKLPNVGIVYNLHHGHDQLERLPDLLAKMKPHLLAFNLNGMMTRGDQIGRKIMPIGLGDQDEFWLKTLRESGYQGPIGILNHTDHDAELRLQDNLDGLAWLLSRAAGAVVPRPTWRTWDEPDLSAAPSYDPARVTELVAAAEQQGDVGAGILAFASAKFACLSCHKIGAVGGAVGPELTKIGTQRTPAQLAESLWWPQREVKPEYEAWQVIDTDGRVHKGYKQRHDATGLVLRDPATDTQVELGSDDIDEVVRSGSLMPDGLAIAMTAEQRRDVIRFLGKLGQTDGPSLESVEQTIRRSQIHAAESFPYVRDPLHPADWPGWQTPVNRDRLYDFYAKQADHFRGQHHRPAMVIEYPGLDGGTLGHWGNQTEQTWADDRWNLTKLGTVQAGIFRADKVTVPRGVCVRLGDQQELAVCFNPETLTYDAVWRDGFVNFSSVRHGFMHGLQQTGTLLAKPERSRPTEPHRYLGLYRDGPKVAFRYRIGDVEYLDAPTVREGAFVSVVAPVEEHPWRAMLDGGRPQWPETITVRGSLGAGRPYAVDTIPLPFDNPWNALMFCGDHAFLPDGSALVCTMQGDVWRATGLDDKLEQVTWRRFASGLHHALGLVVADGEIYVQGRDQITRLHDLNHDGEADYYECFSQAFQTSPAGHDFICGLERDAVGRFYTASGNQGLIRISADGQTCEVLATGFRNPDGLGLGRDGVVTVPSSEGDWTPASMIAAFRPGEPATHVPGAKPIGGLVPPYFGWGGPREGRAPDLPLVYLPRGLDNSSGGQTEVTSDRWGPLQGQRLHFSFGTGSHFLLLMDDVDGQRQGAVVPLPGEFRSGAHRGEFHPLDGQLYVSGMAGWGSYTPDDGCFHRVRYTGDPVQLPVASHVHQNGVLVRFSEPLDPAVAGDVTRHFAQCWNYRYSSGYGSAEFSREHFGARGHDVLRITSATCLDDGRSLFLELPDLQPVNQLHLRLETNPGVQRDLFATVHRLDAPYPVGGKPVAAKGIEPHPILADLLIATTRVPNPWLKRNKQARPVVVEAGKNLTFATRTLRAKAGEPLMVTLRNPDVVPHNWALLKPGSLSRVGELTNRLIADPEAVARHYIPKTDDVLAYTDVVLPQDEFTIWITAPREPGRYPFLCTFPGHWMVMNGELIVE
jgi:putative heme-binding domain-containing protein